MPGRSRQEAIEELKSDVNMLLLFYQVGRRAEDLRKGIKSRMEDLGLPTYEADLGKLVVVPTRTPNVNSENLTESVRNDRRFRLTDLYNAGVLVPSADELGKYLASLGIGTELYIQETSGSQLRPRPNVRIPTQLYPDMFELMVNRLYEFLAKK